MKILLCIPTYKNYAGCKKAIESAFEGLRKPDAVYIMDNGQKFEYIFPYRVPFMLGTPEHNMGVAASWNAFYDSDKSYTPLVANDDVIFYNDTIAVLEQDLKQYPFVYPGAVNEQGNVMNAFSLFMMRRDVFDEVGPFDTNFYPAYFEDNDWAHRASLKGFVLHASNCSYGHEGSATVKQLLPGEQDQHHQSFRVNRGLYRAKWGGLPHHETFKEPYNGEPFETAVKKVKPE